MQKNSGITLLALIITIIIMLILAGVTISIVGGSDGIIAKAEKAVSQTDKAAMQEDAELSIAAIKMDYYEDYGVNRTKYANAKAFIVEKLKTAYTTSRGATMVADSEGNVTYTYKSVATKLTLGDDGSVSLEESTENNGNLALTLEGDGQTFHKMAPSTLSFRSTADLDDFKEVQINGETIDPAYYTLTEGSTIVTLSIDYLKTLDATSHNITVVSENAAPSGAFEVIEPDVNEYNFYYNQPYTGYVINQNYIFFIREDGKLTLTTESGGVWHITYEIIDNKIVVDASTLDMGVLTGVIGNDGATIEFDLLGTIFTLGNDKVFADKDYIYTWDEASMGTGEIFKGYRVTVIYNNRETYPEIRSNINGYPVFQIEHSAFADNDRLVKLPKMPETIKLMGEEAFARCNGLEYITIPYHINYIEYVSFEGCSNLKEVVIENGVKIIGDSAFENCSSLEKITIPKSIIQIRNWVFDGCDLLETIIYNGTMEEWSNVDIWCDIPATEVICSDGVVPLK